MSTVTASRVYISGDADIDTILQGPGGYDKWGGALGTGVNLTYSFGTPANFELSQGYLNVSAIYPASPVVEFSNAQKVAATNALDEWAKAGDITFTEVTEASGQFGTIRFFNIDFD